MALVYLGLGSNLGDRESTLRKAIEMLGEQVGEIQQVSSLIETAPWGYESSNYYLNGAVALQTDFSPKKLLEITQIIEKELGREKKSSSTYADRTIDIDILLYGEDEINEEGLRIPHPRITERRFVLEPLAEIAPQLKLPNSELTIKDYLFKLK